MTTLEFILKFKLCNFFYSWSPPTRYPSPKLSINLLLEAKPGFARILNHTVSWESIYTSYSSVSNM